MAWQALAGGAASSLLGGDDERMSAQDTERQNRRNRRNTRWNVFKKSLGTLDEAGLANLGTNYLSVKNYLDAFGSGGAQYGNFSFEIDRRLAALEKAGLDIGSLSGTDFSGNFSLLDANRAAIGLRGLRRDVGLPASRGEEARLREGANVNWAGRRQEIGEQRYEEEVRPRELMIQQRLDEMLQNPTFSAEETARMRSDITANNRQLASSRLQRVSAGLGVRGMDPSSPAGAALAMHVAEQSDSELSTQLRKLGFDISQIEDATATNELGISQNLLNAMQVTRDAALSGDLDRLSGAQSSLTDLVTAIDEANRREALMRELLSEQDSGGNGGMGALIGTIGGAALGSIIPGVGTALGAGIGSSLGSSLGGGSGQGIDPRLIQMLMSK